MSYYAVTYSNSLSHHGIKGQKWGVRRFQNEDGSYTDAGQKRRGFGSNLKRKWKKYRKKRKEARAIQRELHDAKRKHEEKANKKYDIEYRRKQMEFENQTRENFRQLGFRDNPDWHPSQDKYNEAVSKRDAEVSKKLIKEFGQEKYDVMKQEDFRDEVVLVGALLGAVGAINLAAKKFG